MFGLIRDRWVAATSPVFRGRLWVLLAGLCFTSMIASVRHVTDTLHPFEVAFFRNLFGLVFLIPFFMRLGFSELKTQRLPFHIFRGALLAIRMMMTFTALGMIPLAGYMSLSFSSALFASVGGILFFHEKAEFRRIAALLVGFAGVLIILRPGVAVIHPGALLALGSAAIWAACLLMIKMVQRTESPVTITAYMSISVCVFTLVPTIFVWETPGSREFLWLALIGSLGSCVHIFIARALKVADASAVMPLDFIRLVWAGLIGYFAFAQVPDSWTVAGGLVIFAMATYLALSSVRSGKDGG